MSKSHPVLSQYVITIVSDCQAAVKVALEPNLSDPYATSVFNNLHASRVQALIWIPSHLSVAQNDEADLLAKTACEDGVTCDFNDTLPGSSLRYKIHLKIKLVAAWTARWNSEKVNTRSWLSRWFPNPPTSDRHLIGSRSLVRQLARLRTGYCRTASFLHSRNLLDSPLCTACSPPAPPVLQTVEHLLCNCPVYRQERRLLRNSVRDSLQLDPRLAVTVDHLLSPCAQVATQLQVANALVACIAVAFAGFL